jgi:hypothetical protein
MKIKTRNAVAAFGGALPCRPRSAALVFPERLGRRSAARLFLEIEITELLSVGVADNEVGGLFFDAPAARACCTALVRGRNVINAVATNGNGHTATKSLTGL